MSARRLSTLGAVTALLLLALSPAHAQQAADPNYRPRVDRPVHAERSPRVVIDEAHGDFHTASGRYKPFADLLAADGYAVEAGTAAFSAEDLAGVDVLVIANPDASAGPAIGPAEIEAVHAWVEGGGALLLVADHAPFGASAEALAGRFGVAMGKGWVYDRGQDKEALTTQPVFSRANGLLGEHPITRGVGKVRTFTGQSLSVPPGATGLLVLGAHAREAPDRAALRQARAALRAGAAPADPSVAGKAQGLAMEAGAGRVVVLGEAGMLSAQVLQTGGRALRFGMNTPGYDNERFARNVMRWLSRAP